MIGIAKRRGVDCHRGINTAIDIIISVSLSSSFSIHAVHVHSLLIYNMYMYVLTESASETDPSPVGSPQSTPPESAPSDNNVNGSGIPSTEYSNEDDVHDDADATVASAARAGVVPNESSRTSPITASRPICVRTRGNNLGRRDIIITITFRIAG